MTVEKQLEDYRPGAIGSLLDEYERAIGDLKSTLKNVSEENYTSIADRETKDEDCRSIQTIMNHVVRAGYHYSKYIRESISMAGFEINRENIPQANITAELDEMFDNTLDIFEGKWEEMNAQVTNVYIDTGWGVRYNIDQLLEHAIVHILRHRRQVEKFLLMLRK